MVRHNLNYSLVLVQLGLDLSKVVDLTEVTKGPKGMLKGSRITNLLELSIYLNQEKEFSELYQSH